MYTFNNTMDEDIPTRSSCVSYECHSLLFQSEMYSDATYDGTDSEFENETNSEASEDEYDTEFVEPYFDNCDVSSSEAYKQLANKRESCAVIHGINLLSYDLDEEEDNEEDEENPEDTRIQGTPANFSIQEFERRAIEKKISTCKLKGADSQSVSCFARYQFIRRSSRPF
mmetsp:Transcript_18898/g.26003  ORF Transcript_18898/g.26003 Transcript_18898/m.26003 type:complete len:170 (-) Transcript_18898:244-753(-)